MLTLSLLRLNFVISLLLYLSFFSCQIRNVTFIAETGEPTSKCHDPRHLETVVLSRLWCSSPGLVPLATELCIKPECVCTSMPDTFKKEKVEISTVAQLGQVERVAYIAPPFLGEWFCVNYLFRVCVFFLWEERQIKKYKKAEVTQLSNVYDLP